MKIYNRFLTILLVILIIVLLGVFGYYFYILYDNYHSNKIAEEIVTQFSEDFGETETQEIIEDTPEEQDETNPVQENPTPKTNTGNSTKKTGTYYNNYKVIGVIEIPSLKVKYPIFNIDNTQTLNLGTAAIYPMNVEQALNNPGNVVIAGHNYRNTRMFSKLHTLKDGDSIFITDNSGKKLEYKVYKNYTADASDFTYATREVEEDVAEISLSTCTNDVNTRTVIWAKTK